jgi:hypothetical protein
LFATVSDSAHRISVQRDALYTFYATASKGDFHSNAGKTVWATVEITSDTEPVVNRTATCGWIGSLSKCGVHMPDYRAVRQFG